MKWNRGFFLSLLYYGISAFGASLTIKAAIGVSTFTAMNVAISAASSIKVGTITTIMNLVFLFAYMVTSRFRFPLKYLLQAVFVMLFGVFINFFVYGVFGTIELHQYWARVLVLATGTLIGGLAVGRVIYYNVLTFPIENFCMDLEKITGKKFIFFRYGVDVLSLVVSLGISISMALPLFIREGTVLNMILLTAAMNLVKGPKKSAEES